MPAGSSEPPVAGRQALIGLLWHDAGTAMVVVDGERRIRHLNPMALATVQRRGLGVGDLLNEFSTQVTRADDRQVYASAEGPLERALRGETVRRETLHIQPSEDDEPRRMVLSAQPMTLDDGTLGALLVWHDVKVTHDVSDRRAGERAVVELNEQLEERAAERTVQLDQQAADLAAVNAELEAFSYSVSHDLRAPLRAMSGFARIIEQDFADELPDQAKHYLDRVTENAQQMGSLIDALLTFSRMQRQSMHPVPIDMTQVVRECWTALTPIRGDRRIEFVLGRLPPANGDRQLIRQVWMNLLDNAIKYTGRLDAARIEVRAETAVDGDAVMYLVQDNGAGFDLKYVAKIGQVFQRLHHTEDFAGIGIGLALVQRIVQRHGGRMTAFGEPGAGATFGFSLNSERAAGTA